MNECLPIEESRLDEYIQTIKRKWEEDGQNPELVNGIKGYCQALSLPPGVSIYKTKKSNSRSLRNNKLFLLIFFMFL